MEFAKRLKQYRNEMGYTQEEMAMVLGITTRGYRNYELGTREPNLSFLVSLADKLNVSMDNLIGREFPKEANQ
ncbi:helix-turn-helix domain-containing protein [Oscillibacter sp. MSJ-2]|uniref:Helix-turn-helix domain-containing protein n=1 Tax=Dysosmobacter acutus TaxID=2841504 RepID=A0ABS6F890_9FIRM|nr:helix-turn-helix transcriptional regulator [Dysosmobacter acutus]MBU5626509.1 helix-turn-helix domain-containing protein [Dysosmobacter acutus]